MESNFPECVSCIQRASVVGEDGENRPLRDPDADIGVLMPLSDYDNKNGAELRYKAWVCTNPECGFNLKIRNGDIVRNEPIETGIAARSNRQ